MASPLGSNVAVDDLISGIRQFQHNYVNSSLTNPVRRPLQKPVRPGGNTVVAPSKPSASPGTDVATSDLTSTSSGTETTTANESSMTPEALETLNRLISQGGSDFQVDQQKSIQDLIANMAQRVGELTPEKAKEAAKGDVDELTRQLMEQILPELSGAFEGAGASSSALEALMTQDMASRTAGQQAQAITGRQEAYANQATNLLQTMASAAGIPDDIVASMTNLIQAGKGGVKTGTTTTEFTGEETKAAEELATEGLRPAETTAEDLKNQLLQTELDVMKQQLEEMEGDTDTAKSPLGGFSGGSDSAGLSRPEKIALYNSQASRPWGTPAPTGGTAASWDYERQLALRDNALAREIGLL